MGRFHLALIMLPIWCVCYPHPVLDGAVIIVLKQFGLTNEALIVSYALLFHLILVAPQLILGAIASTRVGWQWEAEPA